MEPTARSSVARNTVSDAIVELLLFSAARTGLQGNWTSSKQKFLNLFCFQ